MDWFNALDEGQARELLRACCAADAWLDEVIAGRPYDDQDALRARSAAGLTALDWAGVRQALDAHPRIGERVAAAGREADWSRREQSALATASVGVKAALVAANEAYEQRFGHIFLIFASGRSDTEMLAAARERVGHDDETEQQVVRGELAKIVALRLQRLEAP